MALVPIARVREHCKLDDAETDESLTIIIDAAELACSRRANRYFYVDADALNAAKAGVDAMMDAAFTAYDTAMTNAAAILDCKRRDNAERIARATLDEALVEQSRILGGMVASNLILEGFLVTIAAFLANREAADLPNAAEAIFGHLCYGIPQL